jgi:heme oxygenase
VSYVRETCADKELCVPGEEIGRNNEYVFVSEYYSPEAFGECYVSGTEQLGGSFYVDNMKLCNERGISSYIEKQEKHFSTFDVSNK